jgi:hypothetical protein
MVFSVVKMLALVQLISSLSALGSSKNTHTVWLEEQTNSAPACADAEN